MSEPTGKRSPTEPPAASSLVGSDRVLAVLTELALRPAGVGLDELARAVDSPKPTVHRALAALRRAGFAAQNGRGHYLLGDEFIRLAFTNHDARPEHLRVQPILEALASRHGETAHYAVLDGRSVVYRAKVDPPGGAVRLTSTIGGRNPAHSTAVGKVLLAYRLRDDTAVDDWVRDGELPARTAHTITSPADLAEELAVIRRRGFGTDDEENEPGVGCLAVPVFFGSHAVPSGAISISALVYRTPLAALVRDLPAIFSIVQETSDRVAL
jgi:IclR family transcriptional regulator, acetate operon repressor